MAQPASGFTVHVKETDQSPAFKSDSNMCGMSTNVAEEVVYLYEGTDIRHNKLPGQG